MKKATKTKRPKTKIACTRADVLAGFLRIERQKKKRLVKRTKRASR